jgi:RHS repeat-associated protein
MIYEGTTLKRILVDGGYIEGSTYYYYLTDHLGNNRVVANASGKEFDKERSLNWSDFEARQYMNDVPRFTTMDPLAEKYYAYSPYAYCMGNPIKFVDPDGREIRGITKQDAQIFRTSGHEVFGHGIPAARKMTPAANNANAIHTDNLIRRILRLPPNNGSTHGGYQQGHITTPYALPILR